MTNVCVLLLVSLAVSVTWAQGYYDPPSGGDDGFGGARLKFADHHKQIWNGPPVVSKRDDAASSDPVDDLMDKVETLVTEYNNGTVTITSVKQALNEIASEAQAIIDGSEVKVTDQDVLSFAGDVAGSFLHMLAKYPLDESPTLEFAIDLLGDIVEKAEQEPAKALIAVTAIEQTASSISKILNGVQGLLEQLGLPLGKRQTTINGHYNHGPQGTNYGGSISHTWGKRLLKRQTTINGHYNHGPGGTSYGGSISHTWGKRQRKRQTTVTGSFNKDPSGTSYGVSGSHKWTDSRGGTNSIGGSFQHTPSGNNYGISGSRTWKHSGGGRTSLGGNVGFGAGGTSAGLTLTHSWRKRMLKKRQIKNYGHYSNVPGRNTYGGSKSHTWGKRQRKRQTTIGADYNHGPGGASYGIHGSHTFNHAGGSKTTIGGNYGHGPGGHSYGVSVSHSWGKREMERNV